MTLIDEPTIICTYCQRVLVFRSTGGVTNQAWIDYIPFDEHFCDRACESAWDEGDALPDGVRFRIIEDDLG